MNYKITIAFAALSALACLDENVKFAQAPPAPPACKNYPTTPYSSLAQSVPSVNNVKYVSSGNTHVCALFGDGRTTCWGRNNEGQLGNGTMTGP